jgi:hypothetical protein
MYQSNKVNNSDLNNHENMSQKEGSSTINIKECLVCFIEISDGVIMNCGHGGLCYECGVKLLKDTG